jgi:catechol 2,3-dioxygenase-like lactoylglutathione lyase family enzyme
MKFGRPHGLICKHIATKGTVMTEPAQPTVTAIPAVGIAVRDQDRALAFYTEILGLDKQLDMLLREFGGRWITVAPPGSATSIALVPADETNPAGVETGIRLATADAAAMDEYLRRHHVAVGELLRWDGVPPMFAFRDPDGKRARDRAITAPAVDADGRNLGAPESWDKTCPLCMRR